jgi:predicted nuclease with TOPRIM domain
MNADQKQERLELLELDRLISENRKLLSEALKLDSEKLKLQSEQMKLDSERLKLESDARFNDKRTKWYEVALLVGLGAAIAVAVMKLAQ